MREINDVREISGTGWICGAIFWLAVVYMVCQSEHLRTGASRAEDIILSILLGAGFLVPAWFVASTVSGMSGSDQKTSGEEG
jgi:hypothetical protein